MGSDKLAWLSDSGILAERLQGWLRERSHRACAGISRPLATPGVPLFARLVPLAELSTGVALIVGFWTRLAAALAFVMVLNFHFATGEMFHSGEFLTDGAGSPVLGGLLALAIGGTQLPFSGRNRQHS